MEGGGGDQSVSRNMFGMCNHLGILGMCSYMHHVRILTFVHIIVMTFPLSLRIFRIFDQNLFR